ncbi:MAG: sigma-70 family RNA polymerase sigma factor [Bacteroidota bacterium]
MPAYSEQEIIAGCRSKNRAFQEHLYKTYYSMFLKVCARYAKDMEDAEQLLNDGFMKIFVHIEKFSNQGSFEGWMRRIMVNTCLDYLRSSYVKEAKLMQAKGVPAEESPIAINSDVLESIEFKELVKVIQLLPVMTRTVFNLYVFDGYTHAQVADLVHISEKTSQWHVHHARTLLQKKLKNNDSQKVVYETKRI